MSSNDLSKIRTEVYDLVETINGWGIGFPKLKKLIDSAIENDYEKDNFIKEHGHWRKILKDKIGDYDIQFWSSLKNLITKIYTEQKKHFDSTAYTAKSFQDKVKQRINYNKAKVRYGVFPCQDTILPMFFKQSYNRNLEVEFTAFPNWNDGLNAFLSNKIDVALHSFPTALALSAIVNSGKPMFFFPLFSFNGYGIFIKSKTIKLTAEKNDLKPDYNLFNDSVKKDIFESSKIIVEKETDFEWVLKKYSERQGCDYETIMNNIHYENTNKGKRTFISDIKSIIYCTNPIHIADIKDNKNCCLIRHGDSLIDHQNFNGLICTKSFFENSNDTIAELVATWFNDIKDMKRNMRKVKKKILDLQTNILFPQLQRFLNEYTNSNISLESLIELFDYNEFHDTPEYCFKSFYEGNLGNKNYVHNYVEITQMMLQSSNIKNYDFVSLIDKYVELMKKY